MSTVVTYKGNTLTTAASQTKVLKTAGKYMEDDLTIIDNSGTQAGHVYQDGDGYVVLDDDAGGRYDTYDATVTADSMLSGVIAYGTEGKVTGNIATKTSSNLTASGATVTVPAGYYAENATKTIASGFASTPATTVTANPSISVNSSTGLITATTSATKSVTPTVSAGYVSSGTAGTITVSGSNTSQLSAQAAKTVTPTESEQTAVAAGKYTTGIVKVGAISSTYVGSEIDQNDSTNLTASGATVTVPAGYYAEDASASVATGSAGTPTATKGTVSNHSVSVTPSVTNTTGYISGGTKTGTAVTVSASELVSGTYSVTSSGTKDITNYASASVPAGSATAPASISGTSASVSTGTNTLTLSKTISVTPIVSAGYVSSGTAGNASVSLTASVTTKGAATITPTTSNQTIASGTYLTGAQTIAGDANLVAENIVSGVSIFGVAGSASSAPTYTATISRTGTITTGNPTVKVNNMGTAYQADGATFTFTEGDYLYFYVGSSDYDCSLYVNDVLIASSIMSGLSYSYTPPNCDLELDFYRDTNSCVVRIYTPSSTVTISGSGNANTCFVELNGSLNSSGTRYYSNGDVIQYAKSDRLYIYCSGIRGGGTIIVDGTIVATQTYDPVNYTLSLPVSGVVVTMNYDNNSTINITSVIPPINLQTKTNINPSNSSQTITADNGYDGLSSVQINAMPSGSTTAPTTISGSSATVSTGTNTLTLTKTVSVTPTVSAGYISSGTAGNSSVSLTANVTTKGAATITPSTTAQEIAAGTYLTGKQTIAAMPSGTAGTPTATKGTVSNHSISVTPSVTNTTGYITGSTKTGTAVTVTAAELASGNKEITADGTNIDVVGYSTVSVNITNTYTATISGAGNSTYCWVQVNGTGTKYYTNGNTFTFQDGDYLYIRYRATSSSGSCNVTVNNVIADGGTGTTSRYYTITNPQCNMTIEMTYGSSTNINFVVPTTSVASITSTGISSIGSPTFANVTIGGMEENVLRNYLARSNSNFTDITWPTNTTSIGIYAFAGCSDFNPSSLPSELQSIGLYAFYNCSNLALTSLPNSVTFINNYAFSGCSKLALTSLPNNLTSISTGAFQSCLLLNLTSLPSGITSIGDSAFYRCSNLALTSLPSNITTIGENAFYNCSKLALTSLPNNLTSISNATFQSCPLLNLTSLPSGITSIGSYAFQNCTSLTLSSLPDSITTIKDGAFSGCSGLTSINCNGIITTLSPGAFCLSNSAQSAMNLVSVNFPNMAASTLNTVFGSSTASLACSLLQFIDIGNTQKIGSNSLLNCSSLKTLVLRRSDAICSLASTSAFTGTPFATGGTGGTVYVPSALISTYQTATNWKTLYNAGTVTFTAIEGSAYDLS